MHQHQELPVIYLMREGAVEVQDSGGHTVTYSKGQLMILYTKGTVIYDFGDWTDGFKYKERG